MSKSIALETAKSVAEVFETNDRINGTFIDGLLEEDAKNFLKGKGLFFSEAEGLTFLSRTEERMPDSEEFIRARKRMDESNHMDELIAAVLCGSQEPDEECEMEDFDDPIISLEEVKELMDYLESIYEQYSQGAIWAEGELSDEARIFLNENGYHVKEMDETVIIAKTEEDIPSDEELENAEHAHVIQISIGFSDFPFSEETEGEEE